VNPSITNTAEENTQITKFDIANEIYDLVSDAVKKDIDNKYKNSNYLNADFISPLTFFEDNTINEYGLNSNISMDISRYGNIYKLYKYTKYGHHYYITFDSTTKLYSKLLSIDENVHDNDIIDNHIIVFDNGSWEEIIETVRNE
jgi:hypothetical protein